MMEPQLPPRSIVSAAPRPAASAISSSSSTDAHAPPDTDPAIPDRYDLLLGKISRAEREFEAEGVGGRSLYLEEASSIVFDLLYSLDFKTGGELVPRLAGLYGYIANELLTVGKTRDKAQLAHLRDMIMTLRQSWYGAQTATPAQR
jgi:flagellar biosynthetic protein FliS